MSKELIPLDAERVAQWNARIETQENEMTKVALMLLSDDRENCINWARGLTMRIRANRSVELSIEELSVVMSERDALKEQVKELAEALRSIISADDNGTLDFAIIAKGRQILAKVQS